VQLARFQFSQRRLLQAAKRTAGCSQQHGQALGRALDQGAGLRLGIDQQVLVNTGFIREKAVKRQRLGPLLHTRVPEVAHNIQLSLLEEAQFGLGGDLADFDRLDLSGITGAKRQNGMIGARFRHRECAAALRVQIGVAQLEDAFRTEEVIIGLEDADSQQAKIGICDLFFELEQDRLVVLARQNLLQAAQAALERPVVRWGKQAGVGIDDIVRLDDPAVPECMIGP